jgi:type VI protein secretion system component VasF
MPEPVAFFASALAVVVTAGAALDRMRARRSRRVFVWATLFLLLPVLFVLYFLIMMSLNWRSC